MKKGFLLTCLLMGIFSFSAIDSAFAIEETSFMQEKSKKGKKDIIQVSIYVPNGRGHIDFFPVCVLHL